MEKNERKELVDIFNRISHGLKSDYTEPETGHIWKVTDYLEGKTAGIVVTTKYGKFLGTAYYSRPSNEAMRG